MKWFTYAKTLARYWRMTKDPRTPPIVRYLIYAGIAYTVSPIDLLPDWIPGLGLMDEAAIVPSLIALAMMLIPKEVKQEHNQEEAREIVQKKVEGRVTAEQAEQEMDALKTTQKYLG